jgi:hypothetical protein
MTHWALTLPLLLGAAQDNASWISFISKEGGFRVSLPATPAEKTQRVKTATGQLEVTVFLVEDKNDTSYVVSYSDLPRAEVKDGTEQKRLDFARDGAVAKARGKLRSEKTLALEGHPGRELIIENGTEAVVRLRIYVVNRRLHQLMAVGPGNVVLGRDGTFFLDSFRLDK